MSLFNQKISQLQVPDRKQHDFPNHIYFDVKVSNPYNNTTLAPKRAVFNEQTTPIVNKQSDYELAVQYWSLRGEFPLLVMPVAQNWDGIANFDTIYGVCFRSSGGTNYPATVQYQSNNPSQPIPPSPANNNGLQDMTSYYYIYSFQRFIDLVNDALEVAYTAFNAANPGIHSEAPWFEYDSTTGLISFIAERSYSVDANRAGVYLGTTLEKYFDSMRTVNEGYDNADFRNYRIDTTEAKGNQYGYSIPPTALTNPPTYNKFTQESDTRFLFGNLKSILFTSSTISVRNEYMPRVEFPLATTNVARFGNTFNPAELSVISFYDIMNEKGHANSWRENAYYTPSVLKWIDLTSDDQLRSINIEVFFQLQSGEILPLEIPIETSVDMKLMFRRKDRLD